MGRSGFGVWNPIKGSGIQSIEVDIQEKNVRPTLLNIPAIVTNSTQMDGKAFPLSASIWNESPDGATLPR